jgi:predicted RNase H-like HicB family nuclease
MEINGLKEDMKIKAIVHPAEEGGYWAEVPALPGCITEGDTWEELMANLKDAIEGWLEVANESRLTEEKGEVIEIAVRNPSLGRNCVLLLSAKDGY